MTRIALAMVAIATSACGGAVDEPHLILDDHLECADGYVDQDGVFDNGCEGEIEQSCPEDCTDGVCVDGKCREAPETVATLEARCEWFAASQLLVSTGCRDGASLHVFELATLDDRELVTQVGYVHAKTVVGRWVYWAPSDEQAGLVERASLADGRREIVVDRVELPSVAALAGWGDRLYVATDPFREVEGFEPRGGEIYAIDIDRRPLELWFESYASTMVATPDELCWRGADVVLCAPHGGAPPSRVDDSSLRFYELAARSSVVDGGLVFLRSYRSITVLDPETEERVTLWEIREGEIEAVTVNGGFVYWAESRGNEGTLIRRVRKPTSLEAN